MTENNPYLHQIKNVLPRILALYDSNPISPFHGLGDRFFWAWKLIDFGNATFQGAAHGLAHLVASNTLILDVDRRSILKRILLMAKAVESIKDSNGGLSEALPHESSFCVTALVAYDLLSAVEVLGDILSSSERIEILRTVSPLINFLSCNDEYHGVISNHLATAATVFYKYHALTKENSCERGKLFLDRIFKHQSEEGWYKEYNGADPGYQSLCIYYLADLHRIRPDLGLKDSLTRSILFLWNFAHPDGSFGGIYGSRNTRIYYPAGPELLRNEIPEAGALADFMRKSIASHTTVTLETMDESNLIPMFNSYCIASGAVEASNKIYPQMPCHNESLGLVHFPNAGLIVHGDDHAYTVVSANKGGVCYHFPRVNDIRPVIDVGVVYQDQNGKRFSTQAFDQKNVVRIEDTVIDVWALLVEPNQSYPDPIKFIILRLLSLTFMRNKTFGKWIKKILVWLLINRKRKSEVTNHRKIKLGKSFTIIDEIDKLPADWSREDHDGPFWAIHMASQGYWQKQDDFL